MKAGNTSESQADYAYDPATSCLANVVDASSSFAYAYVDHSQNLLQSITGPVHTVTNTFEANRDALLTKASRRNNDASDISSITTADLLSDNYRPAVMMRRTHSGAGRRLPSRVTPRFSCGLLPDPHHLA